MLIARRKDLDSKLASPLDSSFEEYHRQESSNMIDILSQRSLDKLEKLDVPDNDNVDFGNEKEAARPSRSSSSMRK